MVGEPWFEREDPFTREGLSVLRPFRYGSDHDNGTDRPRIRVDGSRLFLGRPDDGLLVGSVASGPASPTDGFVGLPRTDKSWQKKDVVQAGPGSSFRSVGPGRRVCIVDRLWNNKARVPSHVPTSFSNGRSVHRSGKDASGSTYLIIGVCRGVVGRLRLSTML